MRIGLSTAAFYGRLETEDAAAYVASLGLPCCEVFLETYSEYQQSFGALVRERLGATQAVSIHAKTQHFEGDIYGRSKRQQADAFDMMGRFLDAGQALGASIYVYHGPAAIKSAVPNLDAWREPVEQAIEMATARGIRFAWEVVVWCQLNSPQRVRDFRRRWPALSFVLDIKQVHELGHRAEDYIEAMGERLCHVHVLDHQTDGRYALPGAGVYDFRKLADALRANHYQGDIILEPYAEVVPSEQALLDSIAYLRDVFHAE